MFTISYMPIAKADLSVKPYSGANKSMNEPPILFKKWMLIL